jgi:hypothetical protein
MAPSKAGVAILPLPEYSSNETEIEAVPVAAIKALSYVFLSMEFRSTVTGAADYR